MKTKFKWLVIVFAFLLSVSTLFVACHKHEYGEWTVKTAPTETTAGTAERTCKDGDDTEEVELKPLSDTSFWTVSETAATHTSDGSKRYTSAYVTVTVTVPKGAHTFGDWTITKDPTLEEKGAAKRTCTAGDGGEEIVSLPVLTDTTVWTVKSTDPATHTADGKTVYTSDYGDVTYTLLKGAHTFGDWTITAEPTLEAEGSAKRTCTASDGGEETVTLPVLTDTSVWTVESRTNATHLSAGNVVYTSDYGDVTVTLPKLAHTYDGAEWTIRTAPTKTTAGVAVRYCTASDGGEETVTLPVLTDTSFWTATDVDATYNEAGGVRYTSDYVTIYEEDANKPKRVAPYDSKNYYPIGFPSDADGYNKVCSVQTSWNRAELALDKVGSDSDSSSYPFIGGTKVTMVNPATGEVSVKIGDKAYKGYVDMSGDTDFMVLLYDNYVFLLTTKTKTEILNVGADDDNEGTPTEVKVAYSTLDTPSASAWTVGVNTAIAITYDYETGKSVSIFVYNDTVTFGVEFVGTKYEDLTPKSIAASECYNSYLPFYIIKDEEKLFGFGYDIDAEEMKVLDGKEGAYTASEGSEIVNTTIYVIGYGLIAVGDMEDPSLFGTYTVEGDVLSAYFEDNEENSYYYEITLEADKKYTAVMPMVTLNFDAKGGTVSAASAEYNVNIVADLPVPTISDDKLIFAGWAFDEAGASLLPKTYKPSKADDGKTLYAVWKEKVTFTVIVDEPGDTVDCAVGDVIGDLLPEIEKVDKEHNRKFLGWEAKASGENDYRDLSTTSVVSALYNGMTVRAKWKELPVYYGEYTGSSIRSSIYGTDYTLNIDEDGNITGDYDNNLGSANHTQIKGKVSAYNKATQLITWQSDGDNAIHYFMFDEDSGVLLVDYQLASTISTSFTAFVMKDNDDIVGNVSAFRILAANHNNAHARLLVVSGGSGDGTALVLDEKIYSNVTLENAYGESITFEEFDAFMTAERTAVGTYTFTIVVKPNGSDEVIRARGVKKIVTAVTSSGSGGYGDEGDYEYGDDEPTTSLKKEEVWYDLDDVYGVYTAGGETVKLDGMGDVEYGAKKGTYAAVSGETYYDVYVVNEDNKPEYYRMTIDTTATPKTATMSLITAPITLDLNGNTFDGVDTSVNVNINVPYELPVIKDSTKAKYFGGWFTDSNYQVPVPVNDQGQYIITLTSAAAATYYAKIVDAVILTVVYNNGAENGEFVLPKNEPYAIENPVHSEMAFAGWYTTSNFADGTKWTAGIDNLTQNITIYAKFVDPSPFMGTWQILYISGNDAAGTITKDVRTPALVFDAEGKATAGTWPFNISSGYKAEIKQDEESGALTVVTTSSQLHGNNAAITDSDKNIIAISYESDNSFKRLIMLIRSNTNDIDGFSSSYWNGGASRAIRFTSGGNDYSIFEHGNNLYFGAKFVDSQNADIAAKDCYQASYLKVLSAENETLAEFVYTGESLITYEGVATVSFDTNGKATVAPIEDVYKNVGITLPGSDTVTNTDFVFRYWCTDTDCLTRVELVGGKYVVTGDVTLYAKWDPYVTLTMVYGKDLANRVDRYGAGDTVTPVAPPYTGGQVLEAWYADAELTTLWTETSITENTTIYCKWMDAVPMYGEYKGWNLFGDGAKTSGTGCNLKISADGNVTGEKTGSVDDGTYNSSTGAFTISVNGKTLYAVYDEASGALGFTDSNTISATDFGNDMNLFFKRQYSSLANSITFDKTNGKGNLEGGKLVHVKFTDGTSVNLYVTNTRIYSGITTEMKDASGQVVSVDFDKITGANVAELKIYDSSENLIIKYASDGSKFKEADGSEGTYTCEGKDDLVLNGAGIARLGDVSGTYTKAADDAGYTYDMYIGSGASKVYYRVTISGSTYTAVNPTAQITFDLGGNGSNFTHNQSLNVALELRGNGIIEDPTAAGYIFRGWYSEVGGTGSRVWEIKPTDETPKTVYAKWDAAVTLTVVYGNGMDTTTVTKYYANDTVSLKDFEQPSAELVNNLAFEGWYTDEAYTTKYTPGTITEDTTIYGKWIPPHAMFGSYKGWNFDASSEGERTSFGTSMTVSAVGYDSDLRSNLVHEEGNVYRAGTTYVYFNSEEGIIGHHYFGNADGFNNDMDLFFRKEVSKVTYSGQLDSSKGKIGGGRLMFVEYADKTTATLYIDNTRILSGVTFKVDGETASGVAAVKAAASATSLTVYDKSGNVLFTK